MTAKKTAPEQVVQRITLHRNGDPIHFDVTVNLRLIAMELGVKAETAFSHKTKAVGGSVVVVHVQ